MNSPTPLLSVTLLIYVTIDTSAPSTILLVPSASYGSLFLFMAKMANNLAERGHDVSLTVSSSSYQHAVGRANISGIHVETFNSSIGPVESTDFSKMALNGKITWLNLRTTYNSVIYTICDDVFADTQFLQRLKDRSFDLVIACDSSPCSALLANYLERPFVMVSANRIYPVWNAQAYYIPNNPAYIPCLGTGLADKMNFLERVYNLGYFFVMHITVDYMLGLFDEIKRKHNIRPDLGSRDLFSNAELFLFSTDLTVSYPRPLMPNVVFLGSGYLIDPVKPLDKDLESFIESSGDSGVVIFSLGTFVKLTEDTFKTFAMALERLPQKVIAKYDGDTKPSYLNNTSKIKLLKWMPQNDLLGHPKTRALVYHGGLNGVQEAIHHAVPVVGIPLFLDQKDNVKYLADKGMAIALDVGTVTSGEMYRAIMEVIADPKYKENAERLSRIQRDRPMSPKDTSIFWIEYVIRHGGKHLRSQAFNLNFFQYHCIDVIAFVCVVLGLIMFAFVKTCSFCRRKCNRRKIKKN